MRTKRASAMLAISLAATTLLIGCASGTPGTQPGGSGAENGAGGGSEFIWEVDPSYDGPDADYFMEVLRPEGVEEGITVGFLQISGAQPVLLAMQEAAQETVESFGGTMIVKDAGLDVQRQQSQLDELILQEADVIIGYPVVGAALTPGIEAAREAGIPFVALMTPPDVTQPALDAAVTNVNQAIDYAVWASMSYLAEQNPGARYAVMGFAAPVDTLSYISERQIYWGQQLGLEYLGRIDSQSDAPAGYSAAGSSLVSRYPDVDIIVTYNDQSSLAAQAAAAASGKGDILFANPNSGQSIALEALKDDRLAVVFRTAWERIGTVAAYIAMTVASDPDAVFPTTVNVPGTIVTPETAGDMPWIG